MQFANLAQTYASSSSSSSAPSSPSHHPPDHPCDPASARPPHADAEADNDATLAQRALQHDTHRMHVSDPAPVRCNKKRPRPSVEYQNANMHDSSDSAPPPPPPPPPPPFLASRPHQPLKLQKISHLANATPPQLTSARTLERTYPIFKTVNPTLRKHATPYFLPPQVRSRTSNVSTEDLSSYGFNKPAQQVKHAQHSKQNTSK